MNDAKFKDGWLDGQMREICKNADVQEVVRLMCLALGKDVALHPNHPKDPVYQVAIITEEVGELAKIVNNFMFVTPQRQATTLTDDYDEIGKIREEAIQVGAMIIRFLLNFP